MAMMIVAATSFFSSAAAQAVRSFGFREYLLYSFLCFFILTSYFFRPVPILLPQQPFVQGYVFRKAVRQQLVPLPVSTSNLCRW
jgi:hypothetical protein